MYINLKKDHKGEFRFSIHATGNNETLAVSSEGYKNKSDALKAIDLLKIGLINAPVKEVPDLSGFGATMAFLGYNRSLLKT